MILSARAECRRVRESRGTVTMSEVTSLLASCSRALSSPEVAVSFLRRETIWKMCCGHWGETNELTRAALPDVIDTIVAAMCGHGVTSDRVAAKGCNALRMIVSLVNSYADTIVFCSDRLHAIFAVMRAHASDYVVQKQACGALDKICGVASPAALARVRDSAAIKLLRVARRKHRSHVKIWADAALARLAPDLRSREIDSDSTGSTSSHDSDKYDSSDDSDVSSDYSEDIFEDSDSEDEEEEEDSDDDSDDDSDE